MKVGDTVRFAASDVTTTQVWVITSVKSTSRGLWIQIEDGCTVSGVWHSAKNYELINEAR